jgi:hypothetical protein
MSGGSRSSSMRTISKGPLPSPRLAGAIEPGRFSGIDADKTRRAFGS